MSTSGKFRNLAEMENYADMYSSSSDNGEPSDTENLYAVTPQRAGTADPTSARRYISAQLRDETAATTGRKRLPARRADYGAPRATAAPDTGRPPVRRRQKATDLPNGTSTQNDVDHTPVTPQMYRDGRVQSRGVINTPVNNFSIPSASLSAFIDTDEDVEDDHDTDKPVVRAKKEGSGEELPSVIHLNVGGHRFTTRLTTLRRDPSSMLAAMFSGRHKLEKDQSGYYFIDSNGAFFEYILEFLRTESLPPNELAMAVYREASYYNLGRMVDRLKVSPPVARSIVYESHRAQFPDYHGLKQKIINIAIELAALDRVGEVIIHPYRKHFVPKVAHFNDKHECVADSAHISVGPWDSPCDEEALIKCLELDLINDGFQIKTHEQRRRCKYYSGQNCQRSIYKITLIFH